MKRILSALLLISGFAHSQSTYYIRADSTKLQKVGGNNELILENSTRSTTGVLVNYGSGRTRFSKPRINGDTLFIGVDTILGVGAAGSLPALTNGKIWIGNGSNVATERTLSGDATINNTGVLTLSSIIAASSCTYCALTYDAKGRLTIASSGATPLTSVPTLQQVLTAGATLTGNNTIVNGANTLQVTNDALTFGYGVHISSTNNTATTGQTVLRVNNSGTNSSASQATYAIHGLNTRNGTTPINYGVYGKSSNGGAALFGEATDGSYAGIFTGGNVGIGTSAPVQKLHVSGGFTQSDSFLVSNGTAGENYALRSRNGAGTGFPIVSIEPTGSTGKNIGVNIGGQFGATNYSDNGFAWLHILDSYVSNGTGPVTTFAAGITSTDVYVGSKTFGGTSKKLRIIQDANDRIVLNTTNTADFNIGKITQSQSLSGDYVGYSLLNTNNTNAESNPILFIGQSLTNNHFYARWNNNATSSAWRVPNSIELIGNLGATGGNLFGNIAGAPPLKIVGGSGAGGIVDWFTTTGDLALSKSSAPDASAILDAPSTTKGVLIPRMTTTQRNAIASPAVGLMIYNTTDSTFNYYRASGWTAIGGGGGGGWPLTGTGTFTGSVAMDMTTNEFQMQSTAYPSGIFGVGNSGTFYFGDVSGDVNSTYFFGNDATGLMTYSAPNGHTFTGGNVTVTSNNTSASVKNTLYKVYTALLTQSGTSAPTATVLENTLGGTVVWTRNDVGDYSATLSSAFTNNKTWVTVIGGLVNDGDAVLFARFQRNSDNVMGLSFVDADLNPADLNYTNLSIEIRVYY